MQCNSTKVFADSGAWCCSACPSFPSASTNLHVQDELWRIFTLYCIQGNAGITNLNIYQWLHMLRDCDIVGTEPHQLPRAEAEIMYRQELGVTAPSVPAHKIQLRQKPKTPRSFTLKYENFLGALMKVAARVYSKKRRVPQSSARAGHASSKAFYRLLFNYLLPSASRWLRDDVPSLLESKQLQDVFEWYRDFLVDCFYTYSKNK